MALENFTKVVAIHIVDGGNRRHFHFAHLEKLYAVRIVDLPGNSAKIDGQCKEEGIMTEDEANNTKCWRTLGTERVGNCIGSACTAWRWETKVDVWILVKVHLVSNTEGFCGPAGKP